jgi:hypothetical protein
VFCTTDDVPHFTTLASMLEADGADTEAAAIPFSARATKLLLELFRATDADHDDLCLHHSASTLL